ncbi:hypothetical protein Q2V07_25960, partial [Escherichia coli]|nr:hypothetical protein [Escherichia coli]MDO2663784.1 hypothetical protein [Escherichia coli]
MLGGADNPNGELLSYIIGADTSPGKKAPGAGEKTKVIRSLRCGHCQSDLLKAAGLARSTLYY